MKSDSRDEGRTRFSNGHQLSGQHHRGVDQRDESVNRGRQVLVVSSVLHH